jgi:hypothetical protein
MASSASSNDATANSTRVLAVLGGIATAIGVAGFVAVVGGIIAWLRLDDLKLSADAAVAAIPNQDLLVTGLSTLLPFIAWGAVALSLAYLFAVDSLLPGPPPRGIEGLTSRVAGLEKTASSAEDWSARLDLIEEEARESAAAAQDDGQAGLLRRVKAHLARVNGLGQALESQFSWLRQVDNPPPELAGVKARLDPASQVVTSAQTTIKEAQNRAEERRRIAFSLRAASVGILIGVEFAIVVATGAYNDLRTLQDIGVGLAGCVLALITLVVGMRTKGFAIFGAAIFGSVLIFGTAVTLWRTHQVAKVQPTAVVRSGGAPSVTGYFVGETSDRVYLVGVAHQQPGSHFQPTFPRLIVIPRDNVEAIEVGSLETPEKAYGASYTLLMGLCAQYNAPGAARTACEKRH